MMSAIASNGLKTFDAFFQQRVKPHGAVRPFLKLKLQLLGHFADNHFIFLSH